MHLHFYIPSETAVLSSADTCAEWNVEYGQVVALKVRLKQDYQWESCFSSASRLGAVKTANPFCPGTCK